MIPFNKIPVADLYAECRKMLSDHWGYIWGTAGIKWTQARQDAASDAMAKKYGKKWIGHMVADCSGVMVYIWKQHGMTIAHGSNSIARKYCGKRTKTPKPGYAAFKWREKDTAKYPDGLGDFYHIGIVAEDGRNVYESRGTKDGFVLSAASSWHFFAPFDAVEYDGKREESMTPYEAVVNTAKGSLNMRSGAGTDFPVIFKLPKGTPVTVLIEYANGWAFVDEDGTQGYVSMQYLTRETPEPAPAPVLTEPVTEPDALRYGVFVTCESREEAEALAKAHPGSILTAFKPPDEGAD